MKGKHMKDTKLTIQIKRPVRELFSFLLDPKNTPTWIESIVKEETNEWPVKVGTIYRNHGEDGVWSEYTLIQLKPNKSFEMMKNDNNYHVRYTFKELDKNTTEFVYYEWVENGELEGPFTIDILQKLKVILE